MAGYDWHYEDVERLASDQRQHAESLPQLADEVQYEWGQETRAFLKSRGYPASRSSEGVKPYVRSGLLANKWTARREGRGIVSILNQAASKRGFYPGYVIGDDEDQAWMHEGRWWQASEEIESRTPGLDAKLTERLDQDLGG